MDAHLRDLERRAESGDTAAHAKLLVERVRTGALPSGRLRLAADLGHEAACQALGRAPAPADCAALLERLDEGAARVDFVAAAALRCLGPFSAWLPAERGPHAALEAVERWLEERGEANALAAQAAGAEARTAAGRVTLALLPRHQLGILSRAEITAMEYVAWTAHDAGEGAFLEQTGEGRVCFDSLLRLEAKREEAGWDAPGELGRATGRALAARALLHAGD